MKALMWAAGVVAIGFGLLFTFQGLGLVQWPSESFMINDRRWIYYGMAIVIGGVILVSMSKR